MTVAARSPARLRGVLVGVSSGAVAVAAHSVGGADLPVSTSVVLLVVMCGAVGAMASSPGANNRRLPVVLAYVSAGQLVGHCTLVAASSHAHGNHWSASMLVSHLGAAVICAALICNVERLFGALADVLCRLILVLVALRDGDHPRRTRRGWCHAGLAARVVASSGLGTRGPPVSLSAA